MNTVFGSRNYSDKLFNQIDKVQAKRESSKAAHIVRASETAEEQLQEAEAAHRKAKKRVSKMRKALKKYKKSGNPKHLNIFGV